MISQSTDTASSHHNRANDYVLIHKIGGIEIDKAVKFLIALNRSIAKHHGREYSFDVTKEKLTEFVN